MKIEKRWRAMDVAVGALSLWGNIVSLLPSTAEALQSDRLSLALAGGFGIAGAVLLAATPKAGAIIVLIFDGMRSFLCCPFAPATTPKVEAYGPNGENYPPVMFWMFLAFTITAGYAAVRGLNLRGGFRKSR